MKFIAALFALIAFGFGWLGFSNINSDIQMIMGMVGLFAGVILLAAIEILDKLDKLRHALEDRV